MGSENSQVLNPCVEFWSILGVQSSTKTFPKSEDDCIIVYDLNLL